MGKRKTLDLKKIATTELPSRLLDALEGTTAPQTKRPASGAWPRQYTASGKVVAGLSPWTDE